MKRKEFKTEIGGKTLTLEVSELAPQTNAAVLAKYGETIALVTVVMSKNESSVDYLPLKVDYEEKFYAAGKIIGSRFIRRESRPSEDAILSGRLVDRTLRPLFDNRIRREIQVVVTILSYDEENDPDFVGLIGASTALAISDVPWDGPVGGVRVAKIGDKLVVSPDNSLMRGDDFVFETFVSGVSDRINMVELGGKEVSEAEVVEAFNLAQKEINKLVDFQKSVISEIGKKKTELLLAEIDPQVRAEASKFLSDKLEGAVYVKDKATYYEGLAKLGKELVAHLVEIFPDHDKSRLSKDAHFLFDEAVDQLVHKNILEKDKRPDGRALDEVRELQGEVGLFKRTHGSALFMRGNTHALAVTTLGAPGAEQIIETMETNMKRRFLLHYNFPPYSVGEVGSFRGPGRREIGHGALAEKALKHLIPSKEAFPYTIRVVSEIMSSNGSSSMATVCASTLSMMDAGVPIKSLAAGTAMGLMSDEKGNFKVLTDIQGPEDHHGDMDFKAAGTTNGVTAIQMDVKVSGVPIEVLVKTLAQAKEARLHILKFMGGVIEKPREKVSAFAPAISHFMINPEKIGVVIGPGGKMINGLIKKYELSGIDIDEDGTVFVSGTDHAKMEQAVADIKALTREFAIGEIVEGKILKLLDFGAILDLGGGKDGMIHISEFKNGFVKDINEVVKLGDFVRAKIVKVEDGRIGLSVKQLPGS
ncbi:MAG: polyribonucleotide nucleotidyltransferase [Parcubacteria group bacterium Gr01-1014_20]|nr:MAG: polyribonucleotide nucleotidyltransferase [Parcubacteria group bacterium Gr01-1014_20]